MVAGECTFSLDSAGDDMSLDRIITCLHVTQAWIPGRFDDIDVGLRPQLSRARGDYVAVSDSGGEHLQRGG